MRNPMACVRDLEFESDPYEYLSLIPHVTRTSRHCPEHLGKTPVLVVIRRVQVSHES